MALSDLKIDYYFIPKAWDERETRIYDNQTTKK